MAEMFTLIIYCLRGIDILNNGRGAHRYFYTHSKGCLRREQAAKYSNHRKELLVARHRSRRKSRSSDDHGG